MEVWEGLMNQFKTLMHNKFKSQIPEKGFSYRKMEVDELLKKFDVYVENKKWVDVANMAFMLWEKEQMAQE
jgi:hypothetical protein